MTKFQQTKNETQLFQSLLPADGGVDLQPPDDAFPPFLQSDIMQNFIMRDESPQEAIWRAPKKAPHMSKSYL